MANSFSRLPLWEHVVVLKRTESLWSLVDTDYVVDSASVFSGGGDRARGCRLRRRLGCSLDFGWLQFSGWLHLRSSGLLRVSVLHAGITLLYGACVAAKHLSQAQKRGYIIFGPVGPL